MVFLEHSLSAIFYFSKEQLNYVLFSAFGGKFEKSLWTFDFGDFIIIFVAESLFVFSAGLREFSK